jgi:aconitate hydratase
VERYCKEQGLFRTADTPDPEFTETLEFDLGEVEPNLAGPKRPHDRVPMRQMKDTFRKSLTAPFRERGFELKSDAVDRSIQVRMNSHENSIGHGAVVIAAITSCTNTSNPSVMLAAGLLARKAVQRGLKVEPYVKTSLAPGSRVVTDYLERSRLLGDLEQLGFHVVGYGCTTCIGNSGPVFDPVARAIQEADIVAASVLSGNRNFEARINPHVKANYLASPPLVVAYALAGRVDIDLTQEPIGTDTEGKPVFLKEIWPSSEEIRDVLADAVKPEMYESQYSRVFEGDETWRALPIPETDIYEWDSESTYIQEPPYFEGMPDKPEPLGDIHGARVLGLFGDTVTTDHISPAGSIPANGPAGRYLIEHGVPVEAFNTFGSRRGNHEVMIRGTFANIRIKNLLLPGTEGGLTIHIPSGEKTSIYEASMRYQKDGTPLLVIAGKEYGTGSSRDWAAKGTALLGVRAVLAESFERIHRSNLIGMGVLPLQFKPGENRESLGLTGKEVFDIEGIGDLKPGKELKVRATGEKETKEFTVVARVDTPAEVELIEHSGILPMMARKLA